MYFVTVITVGTQMLCVNCLFAAILVASRFPEVKSLTELRVPLQQ